MPRQTATERVPPLRSPILLLAVAPASTRTVVPTLAHSSKRPCCHMDEYMPRLMIHPSATNCSYTPQSAQ
eukprot:4978578-Amphidinium_carterae.1